MPIVSKAQGRLMRAAAHTPGGFGGVSQAVGRDFVAAGPASAKLPNFAARRAAVKAGRVAPSTHSEFHLLGS